MKRIIRHMILLAFLVIAFVFANPILAGEPPPPPPPGSEGDVPGGGASIGGGLLVLLSLSAGYGLKKLYDARRKLDE
jgi:hypothetical protein